MATATDPPSETITPSGKDPLLARVEKYTEQQRLKVTKLQEENQKLRAALAEIKSANSRVRRIPKAPKEGAAAATETA